MYNVTIPEINTLYNMANERLLNSITDNVDTVAVWVSNENGPLLVKRIYDSYVEFKNVYNHIFNISNQSLAHSVKFVTYVVDGEQKTIEINALLNDIALVIFTKIKEEKEHE